MGRVRSLVVGVAVSLIGAARASADDGTARRLRPWITPETDANQPALAEGTEASIDIAAGGAFSTFARSPLLVETGAVGRYFSSTSHAAWSVEAIEKLDVVFDDVTPQFGLAGIGVRRLGSQHLGGIRALNFERISLGLALMSRGSNLVTGVGAELAGGTLSLCGSGFGMHLDGYFFARPDAPGVDAILAVSLGYVYSPRLGTRSHVAQPEPEHMPEPPVEPEQVPVAAECSALEHDEAALATHRKRSVAACNAARDDARHVDECNREMDLVLTLRAKIAACTGNDVGAGDR